VGEDGREAPTSALPQERPPAAKSPTSTYARRTTSTPLRLVNTNSMVAASRGSRRLMASAASRGKRNDRPVLAPVGSRVTGAVSRVSAPNTRLALRGAALAARPLALRAFRYGPWVRSVSRSTRRAV
jgi:hypothetical protein